MTPRAAGVVPDRAAAHAGVPHVGVADPAPSLQESLPSVYRRARGAVALGRGTLALTCAASVLLDRRHRRSLRAHLAVGCAVAQLVHDDLALRSGDEAALRRVRWVSPLLTALTQLGLPQRPSDTDGGASNWFYSGGIWVAPAVALAGGRFAPFVASASQLPLMRRAVRDPRYRPFVVGNHLSVGFLTVAIKLLGAAGANANATLDRVAAERRDVAESEAAVASMRAALAPAIEAVGGLEAKLASAPRSVVLEECRLLEQRSRSVQRHSRLQVASAGPLWDEREARRELEHRMRMVAGVAYVASLTWTALDNAEATRRKLISPTRGALATGAMIALAWWGMVDRGPMLTGVGTTVSRGRTLLSGLLGGAISAELHRSAVSPGFDTSLRDQVQLQSTALAASPWELALGQLLSTTLGGWFEWRNLGRDDRPAYAALIIGYSWGLPQALHLVLSGVWDAQRQNDEARRSRLELAAERGRARGAEWATRASHDYVAQSLLYLQRHPQLDDAAVRAVIRDAVTNLERALDPEPAPPRRDLADVLAECAEGYRLFGLDVRVSVGANERWQQDLASTIASSLDEAGDRTLVMAVNQGLSNVLAHSVDTRPTVELVMTGDGIRLQVVNRTDAGLHRGGGPQEGGYGLRALAAAVDDLDGRCDLRIGASTTVLTVDLPRR